MPSTNDPGFWSIAAPYIVALVAAAAVIAAAWISHAAKIYEFRQAWIDNLRKDISDYVGVAEKWFRKWDESNLLESSHKELSEREKIFPIANEARVILRRIRLRFNPRENRYKAQDDRFLESLHNLLNPGKVPPPGSGSAWHKLADDAVEQAR
jgi:cell division protein FtsL